MAKGKKKLTALREPFSELRLYAEIAEATGLERREVEAVFAALRDILFRHLKKRAIGKFTLPGLAEFNVTVRKATKARKAINPFNGKETVYEAKPSRRVVKIRALKTLHDMAESP